MILRCVMDSLGPGCMFAALLILNAVRWLLARSRAGFLAQHRTRLGLEIATLRRQAAVHNTPASFAKCAKFQRLAAAKEKELASLVNAEERSGASSSSSYRLDAALSTAKARARCVLPRRCSVPALDCRPSQQPTALPVAG